MKSLTHEELIDKGLDYLFKELDCCVVGSELKTQQEIPDVIGFTIGKREKRLGKKVFIPSTSYVLEVKAHYADWVADEFKVSRNNVNHSLGCLKYYLVEKELAVKWLSSRAIPRFWGLLVYNQHSGEIECLKEPMTNPTRNVLGEQQILLQILTNYQDQYYRDKHKIYIKYNQEEEF